MKTLFYSKDPDAVEHRNAIQRRVPRVYMDTVDSTLKLQNILRRPMNRVCVIIRWITDADELNSLVQLGPFFDSIRIITILPDQNHETLSMALGLNPSFITYHDNRPEEIASVLEQIQAVNGKAS